MVSIKSKNNCEASRFPTITQGNSSTLWNNGKTIALFTQPRKD